MAAQMPIRASLVAPFTYDPSITSGANAAKGAWDSATASAIAYSVAANAQVKAPPLIPTPSSGNAGGFGYSVPQYIKDQYPDVFKAANGGIFTSPTMSLIGESGPEAVIPLSQLGSIGGGGGSNITINVGGSVISEGDLVATIRNELLALQQSGSTITRTNLSL